MLLNNVNKLNFTSEKHQPRVLKEGCQKQKIFDM